MSPELVAAAGTSYDAVRMASGQVFWIEGRPDGDHLVCWDPVAGRRDALPDDVTVGSRVHSYGGGAYLPAADGVWLSRAEDQRLYVLGPRGLRAITDPPEHGEHRYADLSLANGLLAAVRERHHAGQVVNELVTLPADGSGKPQVVASGWDFYAAPRPSPDGRHLAWLTWRHPLMPWDGAWLWVADLTADGRLDAERLIAGGVDESILCPLWSPDGVLHFVSDRSGWWNLYADHDGETTAVVTMAAELGVAPWEFGYQTFVFLADGRIAVLAQNGPRQRLVVHGPGQRCDEVPLPYTSIKPYLATDGRRLALIGSHPRQPPTVALVDPDSGNTRELTPHQDTTLLRYAAEPQLVRFPTRDGQHAHGLLHPPHHPDLAAERTSRPPLMVRAHPGPTANIPLRLDPWVVFFTSRGFAVLDVDYRGSTGYGRAYRTALRGRWGELDATDCVDAAAFLARTGRVDPDKIAIRGASAGGYTALRAAALSDTFAAVVAVFAIIDPTTWGANAPKFQAHHADLLIDADATGERSALARADQITAPVLLIHGERDPITPAADAHHLAAALGTRARLVTFTNEGHSLRDPHNITEALIAELDHYHRALG